MTNNSLPRPGVIIFDMDGTLVDVSLSYRAALPRAAARYLGLLGLTPPALSADAYDQFKLMGGFNDDWDVTAGYLALILAGMPPALPLPERDWPDQEELLTALSSVAEPLAALPLPPPDPTVFIDPVRRAGGGIDGLRRVIGDRNAHLIWHVGSAACTDLVQRVFEEIYLGSDLFASAYGLPARFHRGPGLIELEQLLIDPQVLHTLGRFARLGIATGRAHFEMTPTLARLGLDGLFSATATMDDALAGQRSDGESLLKPHPYLLHLAADRLDPSGRSLAAYVGDTRDDVLAAQRARGARPWLAIALTTAADKAALRSQFQFLGADAILEHPDELLGLWR